MSTPQNRREYEWCDDERKCSHAMKSDFTSPGVADNSAEVYTDMGAILKSIAKEGSRSPNTDANSIQYVDYDFEPHDATFDGDDDTYDMVDRVGSANADADTVAEKADADCAEDGVVVPPKANSHAYI